MGNVNMMAAVMNGFQKSQDRMMAIKAAKDDRRMKDELFDLEKKKMNLDIQEKEIKGEGNKMLWDLFRLQQKEKTKIYDATSLLQDHAITQEESKVKQGVNALLNVAKKEVANKTTPSEEAPLDWSYNTNSGSFSIHPKKQAKEDTEVTKLMGILDKKQDMDKDGNITDINRDQAEMMATKTLGYNWQSKFPQVNELINKRYVPSGVERLKNPDQFGFRIGQERQVPNKGRYQYVGENKWKKIEIR